MSRRQWQDNSRPSEAACVPTLTRGAAVLFALCVCLAGLYDLRVDARQHASGQAASTSALLLTNATLIDGTGAPAVENAWIRIEGDRIVAAGAGVPPVVRNARTLDLAGRTVLPGLADMHVHLGGVTQARWMLKLLLAHGVTRVKDTGNRFGNLEGIRRWLAGETVVPRVYLSGVTINGSFPDLQGESENPLTPAEYAEAKRATEGWIAFTGLAHSRGIRILSGTDTPVNWVVPGHSLHQELEFFVKGGMSPIEAVRCSTGRAAEAFRTPDVGAIAAGNLADLVIVRGNVAADIGHIRNVEKIILGGWVHERATLLEEARRYAAADTRTSN